jgi:Xaa-Pro aminopeptidase
VAGRTAALEKLRPGNTCGDVATAFNTALAEHDCYKDSRCGYPVGIDWTEPYASFKESDQTILEPNMTFHLMMGNWLEEDFGYVLSETVLVTENGGETLTKTPPIIFEI